MPVEERKRSAEISNHRRVLCVDDAATALVLRARILERNGYEVTTSSCPVQAAQMFKGAEFDLAVLDYEMPAMNGAQLAAQLKMAHPELKIILYTGVSCVDTQELRFIDAVIDKSEGVAALLEVIGTFLPQDLRSARSA